MRLSPIEQWRASVCVPDSEINLAGAALLIGQDEYSTLNPGVYLEQLDAMASLLRARLPASIPEAAETIALISAYLFEEQGFAGNADDYYDPRNSFLNDVMDRRLGIPITLSILYLELGWRLGLPLEGVSFPGHFLVKLRTSTGNLVLDPFERGAYLHADDLMRRLQRVGAQPDVPEDALEHLLAGVGKKEMLVRVLRNLKGLYQRSSQPEKALAVVDRILIVAPELPVELRERAALYEHLECFRAAAADYERYLELVPAAADRRELLVRVAELQRMVARLH
ncbi:MAG: SirB1 family protein [Acidiferrobacterales bacterium]